MKTIFFCTSIILGGTFIRCSDQAKYTLAECIQSTEDSLQRENIDDAKTHPMASLRNWNINAGPVPNGYRIVWTHTSGDPPNERFESESEDCTALLTGVY